MTPLDALAMQAGIARRWTDADGMDHIVADDNLRAILGALGLPAESPDQMEASRASIAERAMRQPQLITADAGQPIDLPATDHACTLTDEHGAIIPHDMAQLRKTGLAQPGYYRLTLSTTTMTLAIAPDRCPSLPGRCWGAAVQIPSLRGSSGGAFGDFAALEEAVTALGQAGADAVALSPVHAQFLAEPGRFTPYSPSSRLFLNALFAAVPGEDPKGQEGELIDWYNAGPSRIAALRRAFQSLDGSDRVAVQAFRREGGEPLERQARFDAEPDFALFLQWQARRGLDRVQEAACAAGMKIGLITDLAVGVDPAGSDVAADPDAFLHGLRIGAPPDPLGPLGQDWGLTSYSPHGLIDSGFAPFIAMLRANMPKDGGIRIDHAFGLQRLWVVPQGRAASDGAYLSYPRDDLLRLVKLEAWRAGAVVIAEDLGTCPPGFPDALAAAGIYGMAVLPFSRDQSGGFAPASDYPAQAVAMSGTHDLPTIAGWWSGRDLEWNRRLGRSSETDEARSAARAALWKAIGNGAPLPGDMDGDIVIDHVLAFLAKSPSPLLLVPMEDLVGVDEQPNLPGTVDEHPNWRRRLPGRIEHLLSRPDVIRRIDQLNLARP
ncbi:MAG: 4-alpha-glucanotransferase [Sphingobium sp.]